MHLDVVIFGGGAAGLWLLDDLVRAGHSVLLLESAALGSGQTVASQGILHGGMKYALQGVLTNSATGVSDMPQIWRDALAGRDTPDLRGTRIRSEWCYMWRTETIRSKLGMLGARVGLKVTPSMVHKQDRPRVLAHCPGIVARIDEQVIAPASFITDLAARHRERILKIDAAGGLDMRVLNPGRVQAIRLIRPLTQDVLQLEPRQVVFAAGAGNAELRRRAGLRDTAMQRRPLHMVMLRGSLPAINGHCIDATQTRVTITSDIDSLGRPVWQVGGLLAEQGVDHDEATLISRAHAELTAVLPGLDLTGVEWATYHVDRAERKMPGGRRPDTVQTICEGNTITAWPTKLVLAPQLAREVAGMIEPASNSDSTSISGLGDWPRPEVARPPWEVCQSWQVLEHSRRRAA